MSSPRMFGIETEFAFAAFSRAGQRLDSTGAMQQIMEIARRRLPCLPGKSSAGIFLANGSRLYIDCKKPEFTTPECTNPWDGARYGLACERMLADITSEYVRQAADVTEAVVSNVNVSYGSWANTWASHESYAHSSDPSIFPEQLIPHLVTRPIYTGGGGFDNRSPGVEFLLSPRVAHLVRDVSGDSTSNRGIFHTKNESLATRGYSRLHLLCGESTCSVTSRWLRLGTTAILVAMIEHGCRPGDGVRMTTPLAAMKTLASDPTLSVRVETSGGRMLTALEIQRHYLQQVRQIETANFLPSWTKQVCDVWEQTLDRLSQGAEAVAGSLDWAIKLSLYRDHSARRGVPWSDWPQWTTILRELLPSFRISVDDSGQPIPPEVILTAHPSTELIARADDVAQRHNRTLDELKNALKVRQELFELDTRFGQLNGSGIFAQLDAAGVLDHQIPGVDNIEHAIANPPSEGRAKIRGEVIKRVAGRPGFAAEWSGVWDLTNRKYLDLTDPFSNGEVWRDEPAAPPPPVPPNPIVFQATTILAGVLNSYDRGDYEAGAQALNRLAPYVAQMRGLDHKNFHRYGAWTAARRGRLDGPRLLDALALVHPMSISLVCDYMSVWRYRGLTPPPDIQRWIDRGLQLIQVSPDADSGGAGAFLGHLAYTMSRWGRPSEAIGYIDQAMQRRRYESTHPHTQSRLKAERAEALRLLGRGDEASPLLEEAERVCMERSFEGDFADFTLTYQAKLCGQKEPGRAFEMLERAREIQTGFRNMLGEARTLLLEVRLPRRMWSSRKSAFAERMKARLLEIRTACPALANCARLSFVLEHWDEWMSGRMPEGQTDFFWHV